MIEDARARGCERIFCVGDLVGFGADCGCGYSGPRDNHYAQVIYDYTRPPRRGAVPLASAGRREPCAGLPVCGLASGSSGVSPERPLVSVIVPTLDEASALPGLLDHLRELPGRFEVLVADGGSTDGTAALAQAHLLLPLVLEVGGGRGRQLNAAAAVAAADLLLFLHADSRLPSTAYASLVEAARDPRTGGGNFELRFEGRDPFARGLTAVYRLQRRLGYYYGDSSIWVRRWVFQEIGGYRPLAVMEDYDFARRLERAGGTACLPGPALTSARRWRRLGPLRTVASWVVIRWLYALGIPTERLAGLYRRVR